MCIRDRLIDVRKAHLHAYVGDDAYGALPPEVAQPGLCQAVPEIVRHQGGTGPVGGALHLSSRASASSVARP
eukprot:13487712-Alexandrium_andersonii.AAC.1